MEQVPLISNNLAQFRERLRGDPPLEVEEISNQCPNSSQLSLICHEGQLCWRFNMYATGLETATYHPIRPVLNTVVPGALHV